MIPQAVRSILLALLLAAPAVVRAAEEEAPSAGSGDLFSSKVAPIFRAYCNACHNAEDRKGELSLESHAAILRGGENGAVVVPGDSSRSRLVLVLEGKARPRMPPGRRKKPSAEEIAVIARWIDAGTPGPGAEGTPGDSPGIATPEIGLLVPPRRPVTAAACSSDGSLIALARHGEIELVDPLTHRIARRLEDEPGKVMDVAFSADGSLLVSAGGEAGLSGEARLREVVSGRLRGVFRGHRDLCHAAALSADGRVLATGSYDHEVKLWDAASGEEIHRLTAHHGAVFDVAFRPGGTVLATASGDRTVKLWRVASGERLDTLSQFLEEVHAVTFSPDGRRLAAGGADSRIRVFEIGKEAAEGTNPMVYSRFAHEGDVLELVYSPDGRHLLSSADDGTVKVWDARTLTEIHLLERQPDWPAALAFVSGRDAFLVGRLDGSFDVYDLETGSRVRLGRRSGPSSGEGRVRIATVVLPGAAVPAFSLGASFFGATAAPGEGAEDDGKGGEPAEKPPAPVLSRVEPSSVERGVVSRVRLVGEHLLDVREVRLSTDRIAATVVSGETRDPKSAWIEVRPPADLPRGSHEIWIETRGGTSGKLRLHVGDLPHVAEVEPNDLPGSATGASSLPASFVGAIGAPGDADCFAFDARAGETIVLDVAGASLGSKLDAVVSLLDARGRVIDAQNDFHGDADPLIAFEVPDDGRYTARVGDLLLRGSPEHAYRLSIGVLPVVTGVYPLSGEAGSRIDVELAGWNLPRAAREAVDLGAPGEVRFRPDPERFRSRGDFRIVSGDGREVLEAEPNDLPARATRLPAPCVAGGRIAGPGARPGDDADLFRFASEAGAVWVIETDAARRGSPADTRLEILDADGRPVERVLLQAVRESYINFRSIDANSGGARLAHWEEMTLDELVYLEGEVAKIFRMPQGPDSDMLFYTLGGKRRSYFDTTATAHANLETCYVVEPHAPGARLVPNGLPVFTLYYENDDDGERRLGTDSRLLFTAPYGGEFLVRVSDANRSGGTAHAYRLIVRKARPDFVPRLQGAGGKVGAGSGKELSVSVERLDGFEDEVRFDIEGLPPGFVATTPLVVQAGHRAAKGAVFALEGAETPDDATWEGVRVTARAVVGGEELVKEVGGFGKLELAEPPALLVDLEPPGYRVPEGVEGAPPFPKLEIAPGEMITARLRIERRGHDGLVTFSVENLPHGVIVDNIGLNGVLIPAGETEREIFLTAYDWVPETRRPCYAVSNEAGRQTSYPLVLEVRRRNVAGAE